MTLADFRRKPRKPHIVKCDGVWWVLGTPNLSGYRAFESIDAIKRWWNA